MVIYTPLAYMTDKWVYARMLQKSQPPRQEVLMEARWLTVGPVQENTWIARQEGAAQALLIDPGDEPDTLKTALEELQADGRGDPDHPLPLRPCRRGGRDGARAPARRSTAPRARSSSSRTSTTSCASRASGRSSPTRPSRPSRTATSSRLAGFEIDVIGTPGHSPDHVTYSIAAEKAIFSGDVLFQGSVGRTDLPGCDHATLMRSIAKLLDTLPGRHRRAARPHGPDDARRRAREQPVPARARPR